MKIQVEKLSPVEKKVTVEIEPAEVAKEIDRAYAALGRRVKLRGFRPGKAPRTVLERNFKEQVEADVIERLEGGTKNEGKQEMVQCGDAIIMALVLTGALASRVAAITTEEELQNWPVAVYQGADLEKVREWEKTWVGKRINKDNIDQVKEFVTDQFYEMFKNPTDWGADDIWFDIVPYATITPTPGQIAMTRKYAPTAKLDPNPPKAFWDGGVGPNEFLMGWETGEAAGFPFPFPKTGLEMAWNLESESDGDTKSYDREGVGAPSLPREQRGNRQASSSPTCSPPQPNCGTGAIQHRSPHSQDVDAPLGLAPSAPPASQATSPRTSPATPGAYA